MSGRENDPELQDQDAEPSLNAPGDEGPNGSGASDQDESAED